MTLKECIPRWLLKVTDAVIDSNRGLDLNCLPLGYEWNM